MKSLLAKTLFISLLLSAATPFGTQAEVLTVAKNSLLKNSLLRDADLLLQRKFSPLAYRAGERLIEAYDNSVAFRRAAVGAMAAVGGVAIGVADARLSGDQAICLVKAVTCFCTALAIENGHNPFKRTK